MPKEAERIYFWDNTKAFLITIVVMGHFVTQYTGVNEIMQSMFVVIYSFHMPLFVFVSGLFTRYKDDGFPADRVISYLILYVALKLLIFIERISFGHKASFDLLSESGIPWYMLAMAVWIGATYFLRRANPKTVMVISLILSIAAGFVGRGGAGDVFCFSRITVFYPFFFAGFKANPKQLAEKTRDSKLRAVSAVILVLFVISAFVFKDALYSFRPVLVGRRAYYDFPTPFFGPVVRLCWYLAASLLSAAVVALMPFEKNRFSYIGASTLPIYFLHRPILYLLMDLGFGAFIMDKFGDIWGVILFLTASLPLTFFLSSKPFKVPFDKITGIKYTEIFRSDEK